ncbi:MAG: pseudouridine synthase [Treponemataceae bacterium]|nr:MAG: pseudouridine synthase [Treponemataceae bacterium]
MEEYLRLHVYLARAGVASRRACEKLITDGRVSVNDKIVTELGSRVTGNEKICLDGKPVTPEAHLHYLALNKPTGYLCSSSDPENRPLAVTLIPSNIKERLYNVGRLDFLASGLVFFTNDGNFFKNVTDNESGIEKEYYAETREHLPSNFTDAYLKGITIDDENYQCASIERVDEKSVKFVLFSNKSHDFQKIFSIFNLHLRVIRRVRIGSVQLGRLPEGKCRELTAEEIAIFLLPF